MAFIKRMDPTYMDGWVHRDICERLEKFSDDVVKGLSPRLMLLMPPRHGKSRIASQAFPAWHLGRNPTHEFIAASYNVALAMTFSRKVQAMLEDPRYPFDKMSVDPAKGTGQNVTLDPNNRSAESWGLADHDGAYIAAGVNGGVTGKGAHVLVIDDPIKNAEEADSETTRESLWDWYTSTAYTRLSPGGGVLVIQTCWHDDDLAGRLQQVMQANVDDPDVDVFEIVKYPAIAECDEWINPTTKEITRVESPDAPMREDLVEPTRLACHRAAAHARASNAAVVAAGLTLLRAKGEPLHPERYDILKLMRIKKTLPIRFWSALYQQNPVPDDGAFFTRSMFRRSSMPRKDDCNAYIAFDFAITEKQHNDWTVGSAGLQDADDMLHVVEVLRFKSNDSAFIVDAIISLIKRWNNGKLRLGFENGQIFMTLEAMLKRRMKEEKLYIPYETLNPVTDKKVRASPLQGRMQHGRLSYVEGAEWFPVVQNEMLRFPSGVNDDTIDSQAWLARLVEMSEPPRKVLPKAQKSWKDRLPRTTSRAGRSHLTA